LLEGPERRDFGQQALNNLVEFFTVATLAPLLPASCHQLLHVSEVWTVKKPLNLPDSAGLDVDHVGEEGRKRCIEGF
jgi:hypothetical protein